METYESTVKLAQALGPGDVLVGVGPRGERLFPVREVHRGAEGVVVVTDEQTVTFDPRDEVRVAHPDMVELYLSRDEADTESPTRTV
ncbi:hypothetical protein [Georgenia satyanarayanai]|uniref:hypothetical protein n=1 Tax=Georgenia satyanarayanai TaxID=860221 RepID=UPI001264E940|nr:hypothetical protein [Georgenia satyanarayanai]